MEFTDKTKAQFLVLFNEAGGARSSQVGNPSDFNIPIVGDFSGDGKTEFAIQDEMKSTFQSADNELETSD
ncbi:MAG: hypothetical protein ACHRXM_12215 [Isosphaerales bacterium]